MIKTVLDATKHQNISGIDICGHSRGGLIGLFAILLLRFTHHFRATQLRIFTYGAPRMPTTAFQRNAKVLLNAVWTAVEHGRDEVIFLSKKTRTIRPLRKLVITSRPVEGPFYHSMSNYLKGVTSIEGDQNGNYIWRYMLRGTVKLRRMPHAACIIKRDRDAPTQGLETEGLVAVALLVILLIAL